MSKKMYGENYIKIGSIVKCTDKYTPAGCKMVGETEDIGCYGIVVGHDQAPSIIGDVKRERYRVYFTEYSNFVGVEEKYVEETDFTTPELEAKRELVLNKIKSGKISPFCLYGDILTKEVIRKYNARKGYVDLDEEGKAIVKHNFIGNDKKEELIEWLLGERYLLNEYMCDMSEEYEQKHKWELSRNRMIDKTIAKIQEIFD